VLALGDRQVDSGERGMGRTRIAERDAGENEIEPGRAGRAGGGLGDGGRTVEQVEHAAGGIRHAAEELEGRRQRGDRLEGGHRAEGEQGDDRPGDAVRVGQRAGERENRQHRQTGGEQDGGGAETGDGGEAALGGEQAGARRVDPVRHRPARVAGEQLGHALDGIDEIGAHRRLQRDGGARRAAAEAEAGQRHRDAGDDEPEHEQQRRRRRDDGEAERHDQRRRRRDGEGRDDAEEKIAQPVDIGDEAGEQVAAALAGEADRGERFEPGIGDHAQPGEQAERRLVIDQPPGIAGEHAQGREEAHPGGGGEEIEDVLCGVAGNTGHPGGGEEPAGEREQGEIRQHGEKAEPDTGENPGPVGRVEAEQADQVAHGASAAPSRAA
ncbi:unnamed protein product, partial [Acidocella sp. C78]